jgi:HNH endonuclease
MISDLTQESLKAVLVYDPLAGSWTWLHRPDGSPQWNGNFAGKRAGNIDPDTGYLRIRIGKILYYAHRLAFLYMTGSWPQNEGDHENLDRADCRWSNLRDATHAENNINKPNRSDNTSGFKGVSFDKKSKKWNSEFRFNGRRFRRWGFETAELAHVAYCKDAIERGGEFARVA